jgi:hypothetical protein
VATAPIAAEAQARGLKGPAIAKAIHEARTTAIQAALQTVRSAST